MQQENSKAAMLMLLLLTINVVIAVWTLNLHSLDCGTFSLCSLLTTYCLCQNRSQPKLRVFPCFHCEGHFCVLGNGLTESSSVDLKGCRGNHHSKMHIHGIIQRCFLPAHSAWRHKQMYKAIYVLGCVCRGMVTKYGVVCMGRGWCISTGICDLRSMGCMCQICSRAVCMYGGSFNPNSETTSFEVWMYKWILH